MTDLKYPHQTTIESYGSEGFGFKGMLRAGHLLALPSGMQAWDGEDFEIIFNQSIDFLIVGSGSKLIPLNFELKNRLRQAGISSDVMATPQAKATYNIMFEDNRRVAGAFLFS